MLTHLLTEKWTVEKEWMKLKHMWNDSRNSIWQMILVFRRYMRYAHSINHHIHSLLMSETHNIHAFTNRATEYGKRMDEIETYVERQQKFDLANDFIFQARYVRYAHSINHSTPYFLMSERNSHNLRIY